MHFTFLWWVLQYGHLLGQVRILCCSPLGFLYLDFSFLFLFMSLGALEFGCRDIVLDVDRGAAIDEDEDQVLRGGFEPGHSVL
jgi:hypothetical protein